MPHIAQPLDQHSRSHPDRLALCYNGRSRTYSELYCDVEAMRLTLFAFADEHFPKGHRVRVGLSLPNQDELLQAFLAVTSLGWIAAPLNKDWNTAMRSEALTTAQIDMVIADERFPSPLPMVGIKDLRHISRETSTPLPIAKGEDLFYLGFTSGSTGSPKSFVRTHQSWTASMNAASEAFGLDSQDRIYAPGTLSHSLFLFAAVHTLYIGATLYLEPSFQSTEVHARLARKEVNVLYGVPTMCEAVAQEAEESLDGIKAVIISGAKWTKRQIERAKATFPKAELYEFYGASELSFITYMSHKARSWPTTAAGFPFPKVEVQQQGEEGLLYVRSPYVFSGYVGQEKNMEEWQTVHDIGYVTEEGMVHILGRSGNMMIIGGENVYPEEIEQLVKELEFVDEAVAVAIPHPYWGNQMVLFATTSRNDFAECKKDIRAHCAARLPVFKRPRRLYFRDQLPLLPSGKVDRRRLAGAIYA
ncbi:AMP-binding protein [Shouchella shacheensis]|uniref:AMP-binding protein n=1 Tax=Shouchella shacheensis TaxID=1649580 RepID=UPI00073FE5C0|nr:AMP-binding protein [Shouchella shacheensis]